LTASAGSDRELLDGQRIADVRSQIAALRNDVTVLRGKMEAVEFENKNINQRMDQMALELEKKGHDKPAEAKPAQKTDDTPRALSEDEEYDAALRAHQEGDFDKSEKLFETFAKKHPKNNLAASALFWMGEGFMAKKAYRKAIVKFQDLIEKHPKSDKRCEAMNRQIVALKELKMDKEANAFVQLRASECPKQ
jgi:tol-pal system protein YbgF